MTVKHPAKFSPTILEKLNDLIPADARVLDPFAGTGKIHNLGRESWGVELEPEWASFSCRTIVGSALQLPFTDGSFSCVATSPTYGNRLADHHIPRDGSVRHSYTFDLGRTLSSDNSGTLYFWQPAYKRFHEDAWLECWRVLQPGGDIFVNVSDFIRNGERQPVVTWHALCLDRLGFTLVAIDLIETPRLRYGANADARVDREVIIHARKL